MPCQLKFCAAEDACVSLHYWRYASTMAHVTYNEVRTSLFTPALGGLSCEAEEILNNGQLVMISYGVNVLPIITPTRLFWLNEK